MCYLNLLLISLTPSEIVHVLQGWQSIFPIEGAEETFLLVSLYFFRNIGGGGFLPSLYFVLIGHNVITLVLVFTTFNQKALYTHDELNNLLILKTPSEHFM